ncbi:MAG: hypothetical protein MI920_35175 [Kiloniellales bacterium]|nr:hypothetical protein [Kiloniellales bacterium]
MPAEARTWVRDWSLKLGGTAFLLLTLALLGSHERPGSLDSLVFAVTRAVLPALAVTALAALGLSWWRRRKD